MATLRRDQTKFAMFLVALVVTEVTTIVTLMHLEHRMVSQRANNLAQILRADRDGPREFSARPPATNQTSGLKSAMDGKGILRVLVRGKQLFL